MKYKTLRFTLVSLLMMVCGTVFADESPEVTFDFTGQTDWKIPTSGTNKDLATFTAGNYSIKLYSTDNYKQNSGYLILGKANSYLEFPAFDFAVSKIVVTGKNGASGSVGQNIYVGENAVSTATTGATGTNTYEIASGNQAAGTIYKLMVTSAHNTQITKIEVYKATVSTVATPAITPNGGSFIGTQSVTLSCDTEGATIYYTLDGSEPTAQSTQYAGTAFEITGTTTVKAIAIKGDDKSSVASATFTAIPSFATIAAMSALANNAVFAFTGEALIVAKPTAKHVFIKDETGSALVYDNSGELTEAAAVGKTIAANWTGKVSIYKNLFELVPDKAIAVKDGDAVSVTYPEVTVADLTAENVNKVVTLKGITSYTVDGKNIAIKIGETDVVGYNQFGLEIAAAEEGKTYQMVGAISRYNDNIQFQPIEIKEQVEETPKPIYIETDLTAQFNSLATTKWTGSSGQVGWAAPTVTTNSGLNVAAWEKYDGSCDWTGDIMSSSVTGLTPGTYKIELYGAAAFTFGRGFGSTAFTGDFTKDSNTAYSENDAITENTGVTLFAETAEGKVSKEIPIWYATNFNTSGIATATLENVIVGDAGTIKIGLSKTSTSTNWHVVQLKGVTAQVDAVELHATTLAAAQTALNAEENAIVTGDERDSLTAAITENTTVAEQTADAYKAAIAALNKAISAFTGAKAAYEALATAKAEKAAMTFAYASVDKKNAAEATLTAEATSAADATAKTEAITKAYRQYAESSALLEGVEGATNVTDSITNPAAEAAVAAPWNVVLGEGSGGNIDVKTNEPWTDGDDNATHKYFDGGNWGAQAWDVALQQKIALPAGKYMLTVKGRASADVAMTLFAGEDTVKMASIGATDGLFNRGWNDSSVEFEVAKADSIVIGVRGVTNMQYNWMSFSDFRLMQFPAEVEIAHTWDFTKWSDATVANLKADAAASKLEGWSDVEKQADAEAGNEPTETSKDNCFWAAKTMQATEDGELLANGVAIEELKGLVFLPTGLQTRNLAIAVNYPVALSTYEGGAYLWLGGSDKDYFVIPNVKAGTTIKMGVESHKTSDARGVRLYMSNDGAKGDQLKDPEGNEVAMPKTYEVQSWKVPGEEGVVNIIVNNSNGCHIYFIDAEIGEPVVPEPAAQEYKGYVAIQTSINGAPQGEATTAEQTLTITPIKDVQDSVAVTFSGFIATMPPATFPEFTFNASVAANDSIAYTAATGSSISFQDGQMIKNYNLTGAGSATTKEDTPVFMIQLFQNPAMKINVVFAATEDGAKTALENYFTTTGISTVKTAVENGAAFNLNGQKVMKTQKGLYIINGKKVVIK
ncbi:chitobiase/beta-hexosaminidase C-terminal domain-containing protein [Prevotella sp. E2-28]|uniref:chitobiase/beta-hexosaminidase C-terminal domain-containing protein n=1 Tax=Prevotella sp. E2-28 TaxID=2913620 RepID=UPI001EDBF13D|nr:chitobiase/beta-hexosaminidase C-terminal domain-containing protein [Prevotella sp. E2-28]UKK54058.1 chitobiase/beta-hexosaminidase C-terminal domain-containing protein [Prevotella sp. E2-28]